VDLVMSFNKNEFRLIGNRERQVRR
jgi:hypothetical protein